MATSARFLLALAGALLPACGAGAPRGRLDSYADGAAPRELRDGCQRGDAMACFLLGVTYHEGAGRVPVDLKRAVSAFEHGCDLGALEACERVFDLFTEGAQVPRDPARALHYADIACAAWEHGRFEHTSADEHEKSESATAIHCCHLASQLRAGGGR